MSRTIKSRAWDKDSKKMRIIKFPDDVVNLSITNSAPFADTVTFNPFEASWMQFTGLTDKNGKEIYESDVVKNKYNITWQVGWAVDKYRYWNGDNGLNGFTLTRAEAKKLEIIGNIYQNPDLLTPHIE